MTRLLIAFASAWLFLANPAAAQSAGAASDSPAENRKQWLRDAEHTRLVSELLAYEIRNIRELVSTEVVLRNDGYAYILINNATIAAVTGGTYTLTFYDAQNKAIKSTTGRFGPMAPGNSRNQLVKFARPAETHRAELTLAQVHAE